MRTTVTLQKLVETAIAPSESTLLPDGTLFVTFPRAAFGTVRLELPARLRSGTADASIPPATLVVHLGEKLDARGRIDRNPPGTIRYRRIVQSCLPITTCRITIPADQRNTGPAAVKMPDYIGEVVPFRYLEIEDAADIDSAVIRQIAVWYPFDDTASDFFVSPASVLNSVWDICKYTIKATTFCGVYVDGDRERIPYEGDAYINQLGHYAVDHEYDFARYSHEYLLQYPTWPTEWHLHSVMMAWMDYLYSGRTQSLQEFYPVLKAKTLVDFARPDGLISVDPAVRSATMGAALAPHFADGIIKADIRDLVDWPPGSFTQGGIGERDNHDMCSYNTVVNAFHAHALALMARIAAVLNEQQDREFFASRAATVAAAINRLLFEPQRGVYLDGEGSHHASLHSNMMMLAFDLVPNDRKAGVLAFVKSRGMACSVYGAQYLLEALYENGEADHALALMSARHDRSWWNMIACGSTMTLEAWDLRYKNNLDWNHAWGAVPANIIPRYLVGVRPLEPGFGRVLIHPQPATLSTIDARVPTIRGPITVHIDNPPDQPMRVEYDVPAGVEVEVRIEDRYLGRR